MIGYYDLPGLAVGLFSTRHPPRAKYVTGLTVVGQPTGAIDKIRQGNKTGGPGWVLSRNKGK